LLSIYFTYEKFFLHFATIHNAKTPHILLILFLEKSCSQYNALHCGDIVKNGDKINPENVNGRHILVYKCMLK
tara:strand:+ start:272 stop:490 length:219 start_codon:yes stop_codon:yes gene_type:complete